MNTNHIGVETTRELDDNMVFETTEYESVADFYSGKSVFITGATGLLGKVCLEKLLYSCTNIDKIYILVRDKKGLPIDQRLATFFEQPIFSRIKRERPDDFKKIIPISGDVTAPNLGMKPEDQHVLIQNVSVVIHSAATIKFNEPLKTAFNINVEGTRQVLNLSKRMQNIKVFVYVSTAYSNTNLKILDEIIYPTAIEINNIKQVIDRQHIKGDDETELKKLLKFHPNTYTFTKALAENVVAQEHGDVPTVIIRPSIITASEKEPVAGWVDSWGGATSIIAFIVKGWTHVLLCEDNTIVDMIPLDYVTNLIIVAAAKCYNSKSVKVYHSCTSSENPITVKEIIKTIKLYNATHNLDEKTCFLSRYKFIVTLLTFIIETIPAYVADMWMRACGKKAKYVKLHTQVISLRDALEYFSTNSWEIRCTEALALSNSLTVCDRQLFPCDPRDIVWAEYINTSISGILKYLLKS